MKNQYFGDVGDYGKYSLLREFALNGISIAVNWYLTEDVVLGGSGFYDGKFIQYLKDDRYRKCCPEVFDLLHSAVIDRRIRDIRFVENSDVIPNARYFNEVLPEIKRGPMEEHKRVRKEWHNRGLAFCEGADLVFLDPDNGLRECMTKRPKMDMKYVLDEEAVDYYHTGANLVYYCHRGRRSDTKWEEYKKRLARKLPDASMFGLTFHRGTQRSFIFAVHPEDAEEYLAIAKGFLDTSWKEHFSYEEVK